MSTTINHGIRCVPSSKYPLCTEGDTSTIDNNVDINGELTITPPIGFVGKALTVNGDLDVTGVIDPIELIFTDQTTVPQTPIAGEGALWVRDDVPTSLIYTDSAGTDVDLSAAAVGATLASTGGTTLVVDGVGPTLSIKGLTATGNASIVVNANDLEVAVPVTTLASAGGTETLVVDGTGPTLTSKGLTAGANITLTPGVNDVTIAATSGSGLSTIDIRTVNGVFAVPAGVTTVTAYSQGAGGGGGAGGVVAPANSGGGGGGGAAGNYTVNTFTVVPLENLTVTIGLGGAAGAAGGDSTIDRAGTDLAIARGGTAGANCGGLQASDGGDGGDGGFGGGGGAIGGGAGSTGSGGLGTFQAGNNAPGLAGGDGAPGDSASLLFSGGAGGAASTSGGGGGGGCPSFVPELSTLTLAGQGGDGANGVAAGVGLVGGAATRLGAGGGGGSGGFTANAGGAGGAGASGYIVLVY